MCVAKVTWASRRCAVAAVCSSAAAGWGWHCGSLKPETTHSHLQSERRRLPGAGPQTCLEVSLQLTDAHMCVCVCLLLLLLPPHRPWSTWCWCRCRTRRREGRRAHTPACPRVPPPQDPGLPGGQLPSMPVLRGAASTTMLRGTRGRRRVRSTAAPLRLCPPHPRCRHLSAREGGHRGARWLELDCWLECLCLCLGCLCVCAVFGGGAGRRVCVDRTGDRQSGQPSVSLCVDL